MYQKCVVALELLYRLPFTCRVGEYTDGFLFSPGTATVATLRFPHDKSDYGRSEKWHQCILHPMMLRGTDKNFTQSLMWIKDLK